MLAHLLPGNPCITAWIEAHDQLIAAHLLMFGKRPIIDLLGAPVPMIDALQFE